jgi:hypothetical protein
MAGAIVNLNSLSRHLGDWRAAGSEDVAYRSLADALKGLVLDGRLPLDARLPGERRLAEAGSRSARHWTGCAPTAS